MRRGTQIALVGLVLLAFAALPSLKQRSAPGRAESSRGACCPLIQSLNDMSPAIGTNAPVPLVLTNKQPATNYP